MNIKLSDHFTYKRLIKFTLPSIFMMIFMSIYGLVDGLFVSNFVGKTAFTAVNFIFPVIMIFTSFGFMFGSGGSALISKTLGEGNKKKANEIFSLVVYTTLIISVILIVVGCFTIKPIAKLLGAEGQMLEDSVLYGTILLMALPFFMLQVEFQSLFITAEKPKIGLKCTILAGVSNMVLDALLVGVFKMGIVGAAVASAMSQTVGGLYPIIYFLRKNDSLLRLGKTTIDFKALFKTSTNGFSELINNIAMSLVGVLYNVQLLKYLGEDGVAAYGVLMYICMIFNAIFIGFAIGTAPIIGYHYGAKNHDELQNLLKKCLIIVLTSSITMFILSELLGDVFSELFFGYDNTLCVITKQGFKIYSFIFLFMGFAILFSSFFTALNDGVTSAIISVLRTMVFQVISVLTLPLILDVDGIWLSSVVAEFSAVIIGLIFLIAKKNKYRYF